MKRTNLIHIIAGAFITLSLVLSHYHSKYWLLFTLFVGLNLFQFGITNWCIMDKILAKAGIEN